MDLTEDLLELGGGHLPPREAAKRFVETHLLQSCAIRLNRNKKLATLILTDSKMRAHWMRRLLHRLR